MSSPSSASRPFDFIVFGATGVTGRRTCEHLAQTQCSGLHNLKWAIAGRSESSLKAIRSELAKTNDRASFEHEIGVLVADVNNHESLVQMCRQGRVLLNLVGPYRFLGFKVLEAAIDAGTHLCDVSGEPWYLEKCEFDYDEKAKAAGITVVGSCGFDSIPADLGSLYLQREFQRAANATLVHVDSFVTIHTSGDAGFVGHATTYECAVHGMAQVQELAALRKQVQQRSGAAAPLPPPPPRFKLPPSVGAKKAGSVVPYLTLPFFCDPRLDATTQRYCFMFPGADASIVKRSQARLLRQKEKENPSHPNFYPIQYNAYFTVASKIGVVLLILGGILMSLMNKFAFTRQLLIKYPEFFTFGTFSHNGPTKRQLQETSFSMTMFGSGYNTSSAVSKQMLDECLANGQQLPKPDVRMKVVVSGPEAGYVATPIYLIEVAKLVLENTRGTGTAVAVGGGGASRKIQCGVFSPAAALEPVCDELYQRLSVQGCTFTSSRE